MRVARKESKKVKSGVWRRAREGLRDGLLMVLRSRGVSIPAECSADTGARTSFCSARVATARGDASHAEEITSSFNHDEVAS